MPKEFLTLEQIDNENRKGGIEVGVSEEVLGRREDAMVSENRKENIKFEPAKKILDDLRKIGSIKNFDDLMTFESLYRNLDKIISTNKIHLEDLGTNKEEMNKFGQEIEAYLRQSNL